MPEPFRQVLLRADSGVEARQEVGKIVIRADATVRVQDFQHARRHRQELAGRGQVDTLRDDGHEKRRRCTDRCHRQIAKLRRAVD